MHTQCARGLCHVYTRTQGAARVSPRQLLPVAGLVVPVGLVVATCVCASAIMLHNSATEAIPAYEKAVVLHGGWAEAVPLHVSKQWG